MVASGAAARSSEGRRDLPRYMLSGRSLGRFHRYPLRLFASVPSIDAIERRQDRATGGGERLSGAADHGLLSTGGCLRTAAAR
jgi:hypothetical protein